MTSQKSNHADLVFQLISTRLLSHLRDERLRGVALVGPRYCRRFRGVEAVEDQQVAVGVTHRRKRRDAFDAVERSERIHLVVVEFVPCRIPAWAILLY